MYCNYFHIGPGIHNRVNGNAAINARCERHLKMLRSTALEHRSKMFCIVFSDGLMLVPTKDWPAECNNLFSATGVKRILSTAVFFNLFCITDHFMQ